MKLIVSWSVLFNVCRCAAGLCLEKRVFYRLISGLHSSINLHLCAEYLLDGKHPNQLFCLTSVVVSNECFLQRAGARRSGVRTCTSSDSASTRPRPRARERGGSRTCTSSTWSSCARFPKCLRTSSAPSSTCTRGTLRRTRPLKSCCCACSTRPGEHSLIYYTYIYAFSRRFYPKPLTVYH